MFFSFWLRTLYQPNMSLFDILGMRLNNQLIFWCVQEQFGQNPTDSTYKFKSLCIILIWREVSQLCTEMSFRGNLLTLTLWVHFTICTSLLLTFNFCPLAVASMRSYTYLKSDSTHTHTQLLYWISFLVLSALHWPASSSSWDLSSSVFRDTAANDESMATVLFTNLLSQLDRVRSQEQNFLQRHNMKIIQQQLQVCHLPFISMLLCHKRVKLQWGLHFFGVFLQECEWFKPTVLKLHKIIICSLLILAALWVLPFYSNYPK